MPKSPFYKVWINEGTGIDITEHITSFTFEDCIEEDDLLKIDLTEVNFNIIDGIQGSRQGLSEGVELICMWGYLGGKVTNKRMAVIKEIDFSYGTTITVSVSAYDGGRLMKEGESNKIWKNVTSSTIAQQLALKYNLTYNIQPTIKVHESIPQGNRTDAEFLKYLTTIEDNGDYITYVKDKTLHFIKRDLSKPSTRTFEYGNPNKEVLAFKPSQKQAKHVNGGTDVSMDDINPDDASIVGAKADQSSSTNSTGLGKYTSQSDKFAHVNADSETVNKTSGKKLTTPAQNTAEATAQAAKLKNDLAMKALTATLDTEGDPDSICDTIITMAGVAKRHAGNWYVVKVAHVINGSGYKNTFTLNKNGTSSPIGTDNATLTNVNKTVGANSSIKHVDIKRNQDSNFIGTIPR